MPKLPTPVEEDPEALAAEAGLVYRLDVEPGISRRRRGRGFSYHLPKGELVDDATRQRIERLAVPPAWTDVWIALRPDGHLQACGYDAAGRKQYLYHPDWRAAMDARKFERLSHFGPALDRLRRRVDADLGSEERPVRAVAATVRLIDRTGIRVGNAEYEETNGTRGATTLVCGDVRVRGDEVALSFVAKGGIEQSIEIVDPRLAAVLSDLRSSSKRPLFSYVSDANGRSGMVDSEMVNRYIVEAARDRYSAKDLRTWFGTVAAASVLVSFPPGDEQAVLASIDEAAERLGNTRAVARSSYVAPAVLDAHLDGSLQRVHRATRSGKRLDRGERTVMRVLQAPRPAAAEPS